MCGGGEYARLLMRSCWSSFFAIFCMNSSAMFRALIPASPPTLPLPICSCHAALGSLTASCAFFPRPIYQYISVNVLLHQFAPHPKNNQKKKNKIGGKQLLTYAWETRPQNTRSACCSQFGCIIFNALFLLYYDCKYYSFTPMS